MNLNWSNRALGPILEISLWHDPILLIYLIIFYEKASLSSDLLLTNMLICCVTLYYIQVFKECDPLIFLDGFYYETTVQSVDFH